MRSQRGQTKTLCLYQNNEMFRQLTSNNVPYFCDIQELRQIIVSQFKDVVNFQPDEIEFIQEEYKIYNQITSRLIKNQIDKINFTIKKNHKMTNSINNNNQFIQYQINSERIQKLQLQSARSSKSRLDLTNPQIDIGQKDQEISSFKQILKDISQLDLFLDSKRRDQLNTKNLDENKFPANYDIFRKLISDIYNMLTNQKELEKKQNVKIQSLTKQLDKMNEDNQNFMQNIYYSLCSSDQQKQLRSSQQMENQQLDQNKVINQLSVFIKSKQSEIQKLTNQQDQIIELQKNNETEIINQLEQLQQELNIQSSKKKGGFKDYIHSIRQNVRDLTITQNQCNEQFTKLNQTLKNYNNEWQLDNQSIQNIVNQAIGLINELFQNNQKISTLNEEQNLQLNKWYSISIPQENNRPNSQLLTQQQIVDKIGCFITKLTNENSNREKQTMLFLEELSMELKLKQKKYHIQQNDLKQPILQSIKQLTIMQNQYIELFEQIYSEIRKYYRNQKQNKFGMKNTADQIFIFIKEVQQKIEQATNKINQLERQQDQLNIWYNNLNSHYKQLQDIKQYDRSEQLVIIVTETQQLINELNNKNNMLQNDLDSQRNDTQSLKQQIQQLQNINEKDLKFLDIQIQKFSQHQIHLNNSQIYRELVKQLKKNCNLQQYSQLKNQLIEVLITEYEINLQKIETINEQYKQSLDQTFQSIKSLNLEVKAREEFISKKMIKSNQQKFQKIIFNQKLEDFQKWYIKEEEKLKRQLPNNNFLIELTKHINELVK